MSSSSTPFTKYSAYQPLAHKFEDVLNAINILKQKYLHRPTCILARSTTHPHTSSSQLHQDPQVSSLEDSKRKELTDSLPSNLVLLWQHAIVLAHIASKRTDDPKIGVGAVLVYADGRYGSVGWNGYPKKASNRLYFLSTLFFGLIGVVYRLIYLIIHKLGLMISLNTSLNMIIFCMQNRMPCCGG